MTDIWKVVINLLVLFTGVIPVDIHSTVSVFCLNDGLIWNKNKKEFVRLSSIPAFAKIINSSLLRSRSLETHNFNGEVIKLIYYEERNLFEFRNNGTKVSGAFGEIWSTLANYMNFTLKSTESLSRKFGGILPNGSFDGILGAVQRKEVQIIPRTAIFADRLSPVIEFTLAIWKTKYRLYIRPEWKHDAMWMFDLFSLKIWFYILIIFFVLSTAGYISQNITKNFMHEEDNYFSFQDHIFHSFAIVCSQGCIPVELHNKSKIIAVSIGMFFWMILIAFSAHAITHMMSKTIIPPFNNIESLMNSTKYVIVAFNGSMYHNQLQEEVMRVNIPGNKKRVYYAQTTEQMYAKTCHTSSKIKYALFEAEDRHKAVSSFHCRLIPVGQPYFENWIASGISRGMAYKRSFDIGLLKLYEVGIIDALKDRWLDWKTEEKEERPYESIGLSHVYVIFIMPIAGAVVSLIILILEKIVFILKPYKL